MDDEVDMITHHVLSTDGLIVQLARYLVIRTVARFGDCEDHGRRSHKSVQQRKVTPKKFSRGDLKPDGDIRRLTWRGDPLSFRDRSGSVQIILDTNLLQNAAGPFFRSSC